MVTYEDAVHLDINTNINNYITVKESNKAIIILH